MKYFSGFFAGWGNVQLLINLSSSIIMRYFYKLHVRNKIFRCIYVYMCQVLKAFSSCIMTKNKPTFKNRQLTSESFSVSILILKDVVRDRRKGKFQ